MRQNLIGCLVLLFNVFLCLLTAESLLLITSAHAQRIVGEVDLHGAQNTGHPDDLIPHQWIGEKFVFLEKPKRFQNTGYLLYLDPDPSYPKFPHDPDFMTVNSRSLRYDKFARHILEVLTVEPDFRDYRVSFIDPTYQTHIYAKTHRGVLQGLAYYDDMLKARERWLGKYIYAKSKQILTYNDQYSKYGEFSVRLGEPLKVVDIWWGFESTEPLWIIVETEEGQQGFYATSFSWTNIYSDWWQKKRPWEDKFYETHIRKEMGWSDEIWQVIDDGKVITGMNVKQVRFSWGEPREIKTIVYEALTRQEWSYPKQTLIFENDILTQIKP